MTIMGWAKCSFRSANYILQSYLKMFHSYGHHSAANNNPLVSYKKETFIQCLPKNVYTALVPP